jgi:steroid 5-alpha reductase family enzyme
MIDLIFFYKEVTQLVLLLSLSYPTYLVVTTTPRSEQLTRADDVLFSVGLVILLVEFTADNQQQAYQHFKRLYLKDGSVEVKEVMKKIPQDVRGWPFALLEFTPSDARRGFITRGLWGWSRHPNFLCEQSFWVIYIFVAVLIKRLII